MKKLSSILCILLALCVIMTACGDMGGTASDEGADGLVTITMAKQLDENSGRYDAGDDINNNPMTRMAEEKLGIRMVCTLLGGDAGNYDTKLRLALTGSEELPDVFPVYGAQMAADMIESGRVRDITDDIEQYMPQRLKEIYDKYPETFYPMTKDGRFYGIACTPFLTDEEVLIIRQDWLDNLGLQAPTNMDEFEAVIKAFTEDDPDGNGQNDTYGFAYAGDGIYNTGWVSDPVNLFSAYTGKNIPGSWNEDENGNLMYGSIHEGNRKTLERMAQWHKNGWIFQEAAATGAWDAMGQFTQGKAGMFVGRPWTVDSVRDVTSADPNAVIKAYPNIRQDNGEPTYQTAQVNDGWLMFNKDFDNMEAFFKYYDWLYDIAFGTGDFKYGYLENYDYDILEDGSVVFNSNLFDPPVSSPFMPGKSTVLKNTPEVDGPKYLNAKNGIEPKTGQEMSAAATFETAPDMADAYALANERNSEELLPTIFNAAPTPTMQKVWEQLQTMEKQTYTNIIYGNEPIEAFDEFVAKWKAEGGDQITQEVNEWYQSVK